MDRLSALTIFPLLAAYTGVFLGAAKSIPPCIFLDLSNGSVLIPYPEAILVKSLFLTGWIDGIAASIFCLSFTNFSISSKDFD